MAFIKNSMNKTPIVDNVFAISNLAKVAISQYGEDKVTMATIGSLFDEEGKLVAFDSVFKHYAEISSQGKAAYAQSFIGNETYREQVYKWVTLNSTLDLPHSVIATPGGTGAIAMSFMNILDAGETVIIPEIAWGSYTLMASDNQLKVETYSLFENDGFNLKSFKETCLKVLKQQNKLLVVINDPCQNPTGYSLSVEEWQAVVDFMNECSKTAPCVILNDTAYIDYSYDVDHSRDYMNVFQNMSENVLLVVAFSCSKSLTSYGLRCGAAVIIAKTQDAVREVEIVYEKAARARWSNIPNAAMDNFASVTTKYIDEYNLEKNKYIDLLKKRSDIFVKEAKACDLICYPYKEGFFVTVKIEDNDLRDKFHEAMVKQLIFTVKVNKGIRIAVCSLPINKCMGLAKRMKDILNTL